MTATGGGQVTVDAVAPALSFENGEVVRLLTVGIDIGSATSEVGFSRLVLTRADERFEVTARETVRESPVMFTPYLDATTIDTAALGSFIEAQYAAAGLEHEDVDSGAIILTGLALATENSRAIADLFAAEAGKFVAVSAGDLLEAALAAHGSGALDLSRRPGRSVLHIDIGGGTTKYNYVRGGRIERSAAIDVGARLAVVDSGGRIRSLEPPARRAAREAGVPAETGCLVTEAMMAALAGDLADQILAHGALDPAGRPRADLLRTPPLFGGAPPGPIDAVYFSGGVSEYLWDTAAERFGDLGPALATHLRERLASLPAEVIPGRRGIRATVLGASQHSVQLSGATVFASAVMPLPLRNLPAVRPALDLTPGELDADGIETVLSASFRDAQALSARQPTAICLAWKGPATMPRLSAVARALVAAHGSMARPGTPLVVLVDHDVATLLGRHIAHTAGRDAAVLCVDGIEVNDLDYLDIGEFVPGTGALPVLVKSLLFPRHTAGAAEAPGLPPTGNGKGRREL